MSARTKLNAAHVLGSVVIATIAGALCQSWLVFIMTAAVLIAICLLDGRIRPHGRNR